MDKVERLYFKERYINTQTGTAETVTPEGYGITGNS